VYQGSPRQRTRLELTTAFPNSLHDADFVRARKIHLYSAATRHARNDFSAPSNMNTRTLTRMLSKADSTAHQNVNASEGTKARISM